MENTLKSHTNRFTQEQIDHLKANHYVKSISDSTISFTEDFKRYFYEQRKSGKSARDIFLTCGIDPDVLGEKRVVGFCYMLNKQAKREAGFADMREHNRFHPPKACEETTEARLKRLEHELAYTRQEVEFLKKIQMADMEARKQWESKHQPK